MKKSFQLLFLVFALLLSSCVSEKKYKDLTNKYNGLQSDYNSLNMSYNDLQGKKKQGEEMSQSELAKLNDELKQKLSDLEASNKKVVELQQLLQKQRAAQEALLNKIKDALVGFTPEELTVEMHPDGKVYVSMSEMLLFKSGKYDVNPKGKDALQKVAYVLNKQPDIEIEVEGHTDTVPIHTGFIKDNWDLSVMRSTSVVRILTDDYGVDPRQVRAAGRGEYFPVAANTTDAGRTLNRRTEIIISPKISELLNMIAGK